MAQQESNKQTIALCMIVKNEESVILRALKSVSNIVDYYCICDTGSTDDTVEVIRGYLKEHGYEGEVIERPWVNFSHNRQEAFDHAKGQCDYLMTLDADEVLAPIVKNKLSVRHKIKTLPTFVGDKVNVTTRSGTLEYSRSQFFKDSVAWKWVSPVHEVCISDEKHSHEMLNGLCVIPSRDGARATDPNRFLYDAFLCEKALIDTPEDWRLWFYLGQSYHDCGRPESAVPPFQKCAENTSWPEEKAVAYLRIARIKHRLEGFDMALPWYWKSWGAHPKRGEALYGMIKHYRENDMFAIGAAIGDIFLKCEPMGDLLFVEKEIYSWLAYDEISICYFYTGNIVDAELLIHKMMNNPDIPKKAKDRIRKNKTFLK